MKDLPGWEGVYSVTPQGEIISLNYRKTGKSKPLSQSNAGAGYKIVHLNDGKKYYVHRLVAQTFLENPNNYNEVNHKDEDKTNNALSNLEWCSRQYNNEYSLAKACTNGIDVFKSTVEAAKAMGVYHSSIVGACTGKQKTCKGFIWKYI